MNTYLNDLLGYNRAAGADDCKLARGFSSFSSAEEAVERAINAYNTVRPYASLNYLTPHQMH